MDKPDGRTGDPFIAYTKNSVGRVNISQVRGFVSEGFAARPHLSIRSPVDVALDGARLGPGIDCALDAGHGGVPCVVDLAGLELDLNYLPALFLS